MFASCVACTARTPVRLSTFVAEGPLCRACRAALAQDAAEHEPERLAFMPSADGWREIPPALLDALFPEVA